MARTKRQAVGVRRVQSSGDWRAAWGHYVVRHGASWDCLRGAVAAARFCGGGAWRRCLVAALSGGAGGARAGAAQVRGRHGPAVRWPGVERGGARAGGEQRCSARGGGLREARWRRHGNEKETGGSEAGGAGKRDI